MNHSIELLQRELVLAARALARRLKALGRGEACRLVLRNAAARYFDRPRDARWSRYLIVSCRRCAARLCALFHAAQAMADRASCRLAYGVLRTLEKELWLIESNTPAA